MTAFLVFIFVSLLSTKVIYDRIFCRYEGGSEAIPPALTSLTHQRVEKRYQAGEHQLCGYLYANPRAEHDSLIVLVPGFRACMDDYLWQIKSLYDYGWSVFAFDAVGSCHSSGESAVGFSQILLDTRQTLLYLEENDYFGHDSVVLFGHSRGGYAACCALQNAEDVAAVVAVSAVNSPMEGVIGASAQHVGPLAYLNYGGLWAYQAMLFGSQTVNLRADEAVEDSDVPVLIIHGREDEDVPMDRYSLISHRDEMQGEHIEYIVCTQPEQNGHTDLLFQSDGTANEALMADINDFLTRKIN